MQIVLVYLQPFWRNSRLKCVSQPKIAKKSTKPLTLKVQGRSRSSTLIATKSSSPVLVILSNMSVPICNRHYARRANTGK